MTTINNNSNKLNAINISELINKELQSINYQIMNNQYGFKPVSRLSLDWYEQGFSIYYKDGDVKVEVEYSCDTYEKHLNSGEVILEVTNVELECFNVDTESNSLCSLKDTINKDLFLTGVELIINANHYKLVDKHIITTDNANVTYSEMSENYEKYGY